MSFIKQQKKARYIAIIILLCQCYLIKLRGEETHSFDFPKKLPALTNLVEISLPEIVIPQTLTKHFGGAEISNMASASISHLLDLSGRFIILEGTNKARCRCRATLTGLQSERSDQTNRTSGSGLVGGVTSFFSKPFAGKQIPTNSDRTVSQRRALLGVKLMLEIIETKRDAILATGKGRADELHHETNGTSGEIGGISSSKTVSATNDADYHSDLFELAAYRALTNMFPQLDERLSALPPPPTQEQSQPQKETLQQTPKSDATANKEDPSTRLEKLKKLFDSGLISQDEYKTKKQQILNDL
jgi:hypothetical protein